MVLLLAVFLAAELNPFYLKVCTEKRLETGSLVYSLIPSALTPFWFTLFTCPRIVFTLDGTGPSRHHHAFSGHLPVCAARRA